MTGDACLVTSWRTKDTRAGIVENERMFDVYQSTSQSTRFMTMGDHSPDIFDIEEECGTNEEYV